MRRGTTPTHTFTLPFAIPDGSLVRVVYAQDRNGVKKALFAKAGADCNVSGCTVTTKLTQKETLMVDGCHPVFIQVRVLTPENEALASNIIVASSEECLEDDAMAFEEDTV